MSVATATEWGTRMKPSRRIRLSVGSLLVLVTLLAGFLSWRTMRANEVKRLQRSIASLDGKIAYRHQLADGKLTKSRNPAVPEVVLDVVGEAWFATPEALLLDYSPLRDDDLTFLKDVKGIRLISLPSTGITDAALVHVASVTELQSLLIYCTGITDEGIHNLTKLPSLEYLDIRNTKVTDKGMKYLASIPTLKQVCISGTAITEEGVIEFQAARPDCDVEGW